MSAALALAVIVIALAGTEIGMLFYQKREVQKAADLAALAGARGLSVDPKRCAPAQDAATRNGNSNLAGVSGAKSVQTWCGNWSPPPAGTEDSLSGFVRVDDGVDRTAVRVRVSVVPLSIFGSLGGTRGLSADAVARNDVPLAAFSVGSRLAQVSGRSALGALLRSIGLPVDETTLVGYEGLAQLKVTPSGLLRALNIPVSTDVGIGELNALLAARQIELGTVLDAVVTAAGQSGLLGANVQLVNAIETAVGVQNLAVQLGTNAATNATRGVFASIVAPDAATSNALDTEVNALDLLFAAVGVGTQKHAIAATLNAANLVKTRVGVVEPPSIAIGGVGATAYTAQVRTFVDISTSNVPLLGSVVGLKLPIMIDAVTGKGTLTEMCTNELRTAEGEDRARIQVDAPVLKMCIGRPPADENQIFSTSASCETSFQNEQLLSVRLLGANLVSLNTKLGIDALPMQGSATLAAGQTVTVGNNPLALGTTLKSVTDALLAALLVNSLDQGPPLTTAQRNEMAEKLWAETTNCGNSANCRKQRLQAVNDRLQSASNGMSGFLGGLAGDTLGVLNELLTLDLVGLLQQVGQLVSGLLNAVGSLLGGILGGLLGNSCTGGGLFGGQGTDQGCINEISNSLTGNSGSGANSTPNAVIGLVGFLMQLLQPILDGVGNAILRPLLENVLGLRLGQVDVHLESLRCQADPVLVQ